MQIIEMYEPDEDLKKKGNKREKKNKSFLYLTKARIYATHYSGIPPGSFLYCIMLVLHNTYM